MRSRRDFLTSTAATLTCTGGLNILRGFQTASDTRLQRTVVVMFDGFGLITSRTVVRQRCAAGKRMVSSSA